MRRREFITLLGGAVAVWPLGASRAAGIPGIRIQYASWSRFTGLKEAGYVEGQNVAVEYRWFYDFQCAKIMNSSGNEIVTGHTAHCR
jgi:putative ABC transport system substrate-binding protein